MAPHWAKSSWWSRTGRGGGFVHIGVLLILAGLLASPGDRALARTDAQSGTGESTIRVRAASPELSCGEATVLDIVVEGADGLWGVDFHLAFDPALLAVEAFDPARPEVILASEPFGGGDGMIALNGADAASGVVSFAAVLLRPAEPLAGEFTVARLRVRGLSAGESEVAFRSLTLADPSARPIVARGLGTEVTVRCPEGEAEAEGATVVGNPGADSKSLEPEKGGRAGAVAEPSEMAAGGAVGLSREETREGGREASAGRTQPALGGVGTLQPRSTATRTQTDSTVGILPHDALAQAAGEGRRSPSAAGALSSTAVAGTVRVAGTARVSDGAAEGGEVGSGGSTRAEASAEEDSARMMLYLVIGMLAAVSAGVAGIAGGIAVARRMVSPVTADEVREEEDRGG